MPAKQKGSAADPPNASSLQLQLQRQPLSALIKRALACDVSDAKVWAAVDQVESKQALAELVQEAESAAAASASSWMDQMSSDSLGSYARLWAATECVGLVMQPFSIPDSIWMLPALTAALALIFVLPRRATLALAMVVRITMHATQAPMHFDSALWCMQTDLAVLLALALGGDLDGTCGWVVRGQMSLFYLASGFWKMNSAFLDPRTSCASILFLQLLEYLPPLLTPPALSRLLCVIAPWTTVLGEMAIGALLLGNRRARCVGFALAVVLHLMIAITPFPNQIPTFGMFCVARLFFALPECMAAAQAEVICLLQLRWPGSKNAVSASGSLLRSDSARMLARLLVVGSVGAAVGINNNPSMDVNWAIPYYVFLTWIGAYAVYFALLQQPESEPVAGPGSGSSKPKRSAGTPPPAAAGAGAGAAAAAAAGGGWCLIAICVIYTFGFQVLGVMELSLANPFASLRMHGGSNHLIMPTGLLQISAGSESPVLAGDGSSSSSSSSAAQLALAGGVVRVEECTSAAINAVYPAECTSMLSPRVREMLIDAGHVGRQFAPSVRRALGPEIRGYMPRWEYATKDEYHDAVSGEEKRKKDFVPFTTTAHELRRLIAEAKGANESFIIKYTVRAAVRRLLLAAASR